MGAKVSRTDFNWVDTDDPHVLRRKEMLGKFPEINKLPKLDPLFKYKVVCLVLIQLISFWFLRNAPIWVLLFSGFLFSGVINHSLLAIIHEISHNQAFGHSKPLYNNALGIFANLPLGFPAFASFKKHHKNHHDYVGIDGLDDDLPTDFEGRVFCTTWTKFLWLCFIPVITALRSVFVLSNNRITIIEIANFATQVAFDILIVYFCGFKILCYMVTITATSLNLIGLHVIIGHGILKEDFTGITFSYYGPANYLIFNTGYHVEHHDFPNIPSAYLPEVKRIAKEYYEDLPHYNSMMEAAYNFITNPKLGPYAHTKRRTKSKNKDQENLTKRE